MGFGEEGFEDVALGVEGCEGDGFPGLAHLEVHGFSFAYAVDHKEGIFVAEYVFPGARDEGELGLDGAVGVFDFLGFDGEVVHSGREAAEEGFEPAQPGCLFSLTSDRSRWSI